MSSVLEQALEEAFKLGAEYAFASTGINEGLTVTPVELNSNPDLAALKEAIKNQGEPVGYVRKYALEHLKNTQAHTVIDAAPRTDDDVALFVSSPEKRYQCIGVVDANGDIYPGQPDPGTQIYVALNADVDTSAPETSLTSLPEGWQLVPKEPTPEMYATCDNERLAQIYWRKLLSAAPKGEAA